MDENVPLIGVYISSTDKGSPPEMDGVRKITWSWDGIRGFIDGL